MHLNKCSHIISVVLASQKKTCMEIIKENMHRNDKETCMEITKENMYKKYYIVFLNL